MPRRWYPHAVKVPARMAGTMDGTHGTRKAIIHTEGVERGAGGRDGNAVNLAHYVAQRNIGYHFVVDRAGRIAQLYPVDVGARALKAGWWSPNRQGKVAVQICFAGIVDMADVKDWDLDKFHGLEKWLHKQWGIPRRSHVNWDKSTRSADAWQKSGWSSHAHSPFNDHLDGLHTPIKRLWADHEQPAAPPHPPRRRRRHRHRFNGEVRLKSGAVWPDDKPLLRALKKVSKDIKRPLMIVSGRRLTGRPGDLARNVQPRTQWYFWELYRAGRGNLAAYPGTSQHEQRGPRRAAADVDVVTKNGNLVSLGLWNGGKGYRVARKHGLRFTASGEAWHTSLSGTQRWAP